MSKSKIQGFLAGLLAVVLLTCPAFALPFFDVDSNSDYAAAIAFVSELGVVVGDNLGKFNPDKIVSRAEMAAIVCRVLNQAENLSKSDVFTDVPTAHWANAFVGKASELSIVNGYGEGKFGPDDSVTYEQAVTMIVRAIGAGDQANASGGYPNGFLQAAQERNLLKGIQAELGQGLSRGSVAVLLYNYYQNNSGTSSNVGEHTHNYVTQTVEHTEERLIGTETVKDYAQVTLYGCFACDFTTYDSNKIAEHVDSPSSKCFCARWWIKNTTEVVGTHEEPKYSTRWVSELVRVCSICGQQEP